MAGYIILRVAARSAEEAREKERLEEEKMIKQGYRKEAKLINPATCYTHVYRNKGVANVGWFMFVFCFMSLFWFFMYLEKDKSAVALTWFIVGVVFFIAWISLAFNTWGSINNSERLHPDKEGYKFIRTESNHLYIDEWVKKEVPKPNVVKNKTAETKPDKEMTFCEWLNKVDKNKNKNGK